MQEFALGIADSMYEKHSRYTPCFTQHLIVFSLTETVQVVTIFPASKS